MRMKRVVLGSVVLAMVLSACGGAITEQIIESQDGVGNVEIDENSGSVVIEFEDEEGESSGTFGGGEVPADFPVPVPSGGTVMGVFTTAGDTSLSLTYSSTEFNDIKDFYANWAASAGEELSTFESSSPPSVAWSIQDGDTNYNVSASDLGGEVIVTIIVSSTG